MSLDNIKFTPNLIADLYDKSLVDLNITKAKSQSATSKGVSFLGNNEKNILIIINESDAAFLPDEDLNFLMNILKACKLSMADIALINCFQNKALHYDVLVKKFSPEKILFFDVEPASLDFPLQFPNYQLQKYNHQTYLSAPALKILAKDSNQKKQLWTCLITLFQIT
jgi:hypothetical protein